MMDKTTGEWIPPFIKSSYNYDRDAESVATGLQCDDPTKARQEFKEECDINTIVERFGLGYEAPGIPDFPMSVDFSDMALDYHSAMNLVKQAEEEFMSLPAAVRDRFGHDPGAVLAFIEDAGNREEAIQLGLIEKPPQAAPAAPAPAAEPPAQSPT